MRFRPFTTVLILLLIVRCDGQNTPQQSKDSESRNDGIPVLMAALSGAGASASLEFSGICDSTDFPSFHFPTRFDRSPLQVALDMFSENPAMQVWQESDGIIRISGAETPHDLLNVKISKVRFTNDQATDRPLFDPMEATWAILRSTEVRQFEAAHNIERRAESVHLPHAPFTVQSPHISGDLTNVTVSQALDHLFKTFPGLWIYENCGGTVQFVFVANSPNWELALRDLERRNRTESITPRN